MGKPNRLNYFIHHYINEMSSRIVAASGRPCDRFHLGKHILLGLKDAPDFISQIDGGTDGSETAGSVLERSVRCATCFKTLGLGCGDVVAIMAPNHLDLCVPIYAAMFLGIAVCPIDWTLGVKEFAEALKISKPKLIFCQDAQAKDIKEAVDLIQLGVTIIAFDESDICVSFKKFHEKYAKAVDVETYEPADIDAEENIIALVATSGTSGLPKFAAVTHMNLAVSLPFVLSPFDNFPTPTRLCVVCSPLQWLSALAMIIISPILRMGRLQTSSPLTPDHALQIIRKYKPTYSIMSPPFLTLLMRSNNYQVEDLRSFELINIGGSAVSSDLIRNLQVTYL